VPLGVETPRDANAASGRAVVAFEVCICDQARRVECYDGSLFSWQMEQLLALTFSADFIYAVSGIRSRGWTLIGHAPLAAATEAAPDFVARIAAGDRDAELEFVRRYERGIHTLVRRYCRPGDAAVDDLSQEVLMTVLERLRAGAIREAAALPGYVQTTVAHMASAEYRRRRSAEPVAAIEHLASSDNPIESLSARQLSSTLRAVLADMPVARDREVLVRFYLNEDDKEDVCRTLGIDHAHFHRVVFRARERFRALLSRSGIEEA